MKKAIITLKDGKKFEYENQYIWGYKDELNDDRTKFIEIGKFVFRKDEILMIEIIELEKEGEQENGIN